MEDSLVFEPLTPARKFLVDLRLKMGKLTYGTEINGVKRHYRTRNSRVCSKHQGTDLDVEVRSYMRATLEEFRHSVSDEDLRSRIDQIMSEPSPDRVQLMELVWTTLQHNNLVFVYHD